MISNLAQIRKASHTLISTHRLSSWPNLLHIPKNRPQFTERNLEKKIVIIFNFINYHDNSLPHVQSAISKIKKKRNDMNNIWLHFSLNERSFIVYLMILMYTKEIHIKQLNMTNANLMHQLLPKCAFVFIYLIINIHLFKTVLQHGGYNLFILTHNLLINV